MGSASQVLWSIRRKEQPHQRDDQIGAEAELVKYGALSKINTERPFLQHLHDLGYATADGWIAEHFERIGWESTIDVLDKYV